MRVLVLSDTHTQGNPKEVISLIKDEAKLSDCCLHAGDFTDYQLLEALSKLTTLYAVAGNMDSQAIRDNLPDKRLISLEEVTIGLTHGRGAPMNIIDYVNKIFTGEFSKIDMFVFGHSHTPYDQEIKGKIYFNPGSVTDTIFAPYRSYGILEINGKNIKRKIVKLS